MPDQPLDPYGLNSSAKSMVLSVLGGNNLGLIRFTFSGLLLNQSIIGKVPLAIQSGKIAVVYNPGIQGAEYRSIANEMHLSFLSATLAQRALIVHEASHAALDCMGVSQSRSVRVVDSEAVAYIAQQVYFLDRTGDLLVGSGKKALKFSVAGAIANKIVVNPGYECDYFEILQMRSAIMQDPEYGASSFTEQAQYSGL